MTTISREQLKAPSLPRESFKVEPLGGDVIVQGLLLTDQLALSAQVHARSKPLEGESEEDAKLRARSMRVTETLARCVVLDDGKALFTAAEWDVFGSANPELALDLYQVAQRLNGEDEEASAKN